MDERTALGERVTALLEAACGPDRLPGAVAIVTDREGILHEGATGVRRLGGADPMSPDTVCWIASMTKPLTAAVAMQLVAQGRLRLDDPVGRIQPELDAIQVLVGWRADDTPVLRAPARPITLRHLLTHTSGLAHGLWNADIARYQRVHDLPPTTSGRRAALAVPLASDPGERWEYGLGIDWLGRVIETVTGERLGAVLEERLLAPLGMRDTAFRIAPDMRARLATVHARADDGRLAPTSFEVAQAPETEMGGGGLYSTARDYARFLRMMLNGGELDGVRVLDRETVALMGQNAMGDLRVVPLASANPAMTQDMDPLPGIPKTWGLSFMRNEQPVPGGRAAGSLAWAGLANTHFWIDPARGIACALLTQVLPFGDPEVTALLEGLEQAVYATA